MTVAVSFAGSPSVPALVQEIKLPGGADTQQIVLNNIVWPPGAWDEWILYVSIDRQEMLCAQFTGTITSPPQPIVINGPLLPATYSPADASIDHLRIKIKSLRHLGVVTGIITEVTAAVGTGPLAAGTIRCMHLAADRSQDTNPTEGGIDWAANINDALLATDDWGAQVNGQSRVLSVLTQKLDGSSPILNFTILAYDSNSGTFYLGPSDPASFEIRPGDIFVVRFIPQWNVTFDKFTDPGMINGQYGGGIGTLGDLALQGRIIDGAGKRQIAAVSANDNSSYSFSSPFANVDQTSVPIIEFQAWLGATDGPKLNVATYQQVGDLNVLIPGVLQRGYLVQVCCVDADGSESPDELNPSREFFGSAQQSYGVGGNLQEVARLEFG